MLELDTPHGPARAHLHTAPEARGEVVAACNALCRLAGTSPREPALLSGDVRELSGNARCVHVTHSITSEAPNSPSLRDISGQGAA
jgi:hypothetical protein